MNSIEIIKLNQTVYRTLVKETQICGSSYTNQAYQTRSKQVIFSASSGDVDDHHQSVLQTKLRLQTLKIPIDLDD
jgi:hypothetical protein